MKHFSWIPFGSWLVTGFVWWLLPNEPAPFRAALLISLCFTAFAAGATLITQNETNN